MCLWEHIGIIATYLSVFRGWRYTYLALLAIFSCFEGSCWFLGCAGCAHVEQKLMADIAAGFVKWDICHNPLGSWISFKLQADAYRYYNIWEYIPESRGPEKKTRKERIFLLFFFFNPSRRERNGFFCMFSNVRTIVQIWNRIIPVKPLDSRFPSFAEDHTL